MAASTALASTVDFVSHSIIERHHGRLWAEPNEGAPGATFSFSIPLRSE